MRIRIPGYYDRTRNAQKTCSLVKAASGAICLRRRRRARPWAWTAIRVCVCACACLHARGRQNHDKQDSHGASRNAALPAWVLPALSALAPCSSIGWAPPSCSRLRLSQLFRLGSSQLFRLGSSQLFPAGLLAALPAWLLATLPADLFAAPPACAPRNSFRLAPGLTSRRSAEPLHSTNV